MIFITYCFMSLYWEWKILLCVILTTPFLVMPTHHLSNLLGPMFHILTQPTTSSSILVELPQPLIRPPIRIGFRILIFNLFWMTQKMKTFMRQGMNRAFFQIIKQKRLCAWIPTLFVITGRNACPVLEFKRRRHFHINTGANTITALECIRPRFLPYRIGTTTVQKMIFIQGQKLYPFKHRGIIHIQFMTYEVDHVRHGDLVYCFVLLGDQVLT